MATVYIDKKDEYINVAYDKDVEIQITHNQPLSVQVVHGDLGDGSTLDVLRSNDRVNWVSMLSSPADTTSEGVFMVVEQSTPYKFLKVSPGTGSQQTYSVYPYQRS